jgi:hypothetical protein
VGLEEEMDMTESKNPMIACMLVLLLVVSGFNYQAQATRPREDVYLSWDTTKVMLRSAVLDVRFTENLKGAQQLPVDGGYYLVHFEDRPDRNTAARLICAISQGNIMEYIPSCTYLCRLDTSHMTSLHSIKEVDWIGMWKPEYKISPQVYERGETTMTSGGIPFEGEMNLTMKKVSQPDNEFIVTFFKTENASDYKDQIEVLGGVVRTYTVNRMYIHIDKEYLPNIAALHGVYWIEKRHFATPVNDNDTWIVQTYEYGNRKIFNYGITGSGQVVAVADSGIDVDHLLFWDSINGFPSHTFNGAHRKVVAYYNWYQTGSLVALPPPGSSYYDPGEGYYPGPSDPMYTVYDWDFGQGHGSHVSGTVAGEWETGVPLPTWGLFGIFSTPVYDFFEGNAYKAQLVFQDVARPDSAFFYLPPDLNDFNPPNGDYPGSVGLFPQAMADGAYIHSNSWVEGGFGEYDSHAQDVDEMMWNNKDFLIVFANGNDGPENTTVTPPATAKDCLSIGAAESTFPGFPLDSENVAFFSSRGPTRDGRVKPDVCAPGFFTFSAFNNDVTDGAFLHDDLAGYLGTSMATPTVAGCCALVREYFMTGWYDPVGASTGFMSTGGFTPTAALMKAVIIQSGQPMTGTYTGGTIPGTGQGWGRVLLDNALYFPGDTRSLLVDDNRTGLDSAGLGGPSFNSYTVTVGFGQPLDVTMVYTDPPGTAGAGNQMINILYVEVRHPNGVDWYLSGAGNFTDSQSVRNCSTIYPDTVQKVRITNPDPGVYTIFVGAFSTDQVVPGWNVQPYALTVCGNLVQSQGNVQFDKAYYHSSDTVTISLSDGDLAGTGTAAVTLTSAITGDSESVILSETGGSTGIFQGTFSCDPVGGTTPDDGLLNVTDPDTITVIYNDVNPAGVRQDTAFIDGTPPVISNVNANACNGTSVVVTWDTDENATSAVMWGMTPSYGTTRTDSTPRMNHLMEIDGLSMGTDYYYQVCSTDEAGNTACSGPHTFTTPMIFTPPQYHAGYVAQFTYGVVLDDDDMWTGHDDTGGIQHGVFQFDLTSLPCNALITSAQIVLFRQAGQFQDIELMTWSCNLIDFPRDLHLNATFDCIHNAPILAPLSPTWDTFTLASDLPGTVYVLTLTNPDDVASFNKGHQRASRLTFRLDGPVTGTYVVSWDTGFRQDLGSLGVCSKPQLIITYDLSGICPQQSTPSAPIPSVCPLAKTNIRLAQDLQGEAQQILQEAQKKGLDTAAAEKLMASANEYLEKAQQFCVESTNCIAGNWNALKAMELYNQVIDELRKLLGK